tara:strand:- start:1588 stop:2019 length:432 start_codon:yes stop_codon:yes gene_type:complete
MQTIENLNSIIKLNKALTNHDWHYERSEDPGVYRRGRSQRNELNILMTAIGNKTLALSLYNKACPWIEITESDEVTPDRFSLIEQAQELLDCGDSKEAAEGRGMMNVINAIMDAIENEADKKEDQSSDSDCIDEIYAILNTSV